MHYVQQGLLYLHIFTGGLGLLLFWIPIFGRKGGFNHRRFGVFFRRTMLTSVISRGHIGAVLDSRSYNGSS